MGAFGNSFHSDWSVHINTKNICKKNQLSFMIFEYLFSVNDKTAEWSFKTRYVNQYRYDEALCLSGYFEAILLILQYTFEKWNHCLGHLIRDQHEFAANISPHNKTFCTTIKTSVNNNLFINVQYLVTTVFLLELCIALQISLSLQICTFSRNAFKYLSYWIFKEVIINLFLHERLLWMFFDRYLYKIQNLLKLQLALTYFF